ncbi:lipoate-protein ligase A [Mycoplasmopsis californica HAZ160_1]|uniref:lipoate--protein ligase n=1 Tax=Mycoplasmopsis californica HAZ160_1 TaxID=1397850 RepID=A0AAT9F7A0_9BACT|nr:lipoate--protein ligase [Mycoplasmopsis californica]BAP00770.1 lipoate-protein ligase A [Mycoplasmopsis californica HAZ160_1]BBG40624.1 lipoate-protein ligase A [Mycoplasmopsis californica]BBG41219.1 lipoate-protein ligase A [Mycoplasmopsis californica]BBG41812.1 lipoate-protein ligase A [Mycoplasmopsis californica]BBG42406.1 lipoate-protein ligase A [Mycoplasmopsis californica]
MQIYRIKETSPYITLPIENLILNDPEMTGDILILYQHDNAIIIGNNQNAHEEINRQYVLDHNIKLARRKSGGGAVYHDMGNINFSFITDYNKQGGYERFLAPIIGFLRSLGLNAEFHGRNDVHVNGCKISGNAQYLSKNRIVSHGTILYNVDLTKLSSALNPARIKYESKGIQSVRARVTNVYQELKEKMPVEKFITKLINYFIQHNNGELKEVPYEKYKIQLEKMMNEVSSEDWIFNKGATFTFRSGDKFKGGIVHVKGNIEKGIINDLRFEGDFLSKKDVREIEPLFNNLPLTENSLRQVFNSIDFIEYFGTVTQDEIIKLILG